MNINRSRTSPAAWAHRLCPSIIQTPHGIETDPATYANAFAPYATPLHFQLSSGITPCQACYTVRCSKLSGNYRITS